MSHTSVVEQIRGCGVWSIQNGKIGDDLKEYQSQFNTAFATPTGFDLLARFTTKDSQISDSIADILDDCCLCLFKRIKYGPTIHTFFGNIEEKGVDCLLVALWPKQSIVTFYPTTQKRPVQRQHSIFGLLEVTSDNAKSLEADRVTMPEGGLYVYLSILVYDK